MECNSLPGLKRTAFPGGILTSAPVRGLRPMPVLRGRTLNTPKPRNSMRSPLAKDSFMLPNTVSTATVQLLSNATGTFGDGNDQMVNLASVTLRLSEPEQTTQTVFFLRADFHGRNLEQVES